ncbi:MAG: hypothetical protein NEA02_04010, partial [Thermoanaerobaculia bacterium]|nr:hypothetical protein [Thermoanaerobaculia bacterium]
MALNRALPVIPVARVTSPEDVAARPFWKLAGVNGAPESEVSVSASTRVRFAATAESFVVLFESTAEP